MVWAGAAGGAAVKLVAPERFGRASLASYLLLGWAGLAALDPLLAALPPRDLALLAGGGLLYSLGVAVHLSTGLPYDNALWHASPQPPADTVFRGWSRHLTGCSLLEGESTGSWAGMSAHAGRPLSTCTPILPLPGQKRKIPSQSQELVRFCPGI